MEPSLTPFTPMSHHFTPFHAIYPYFTPFHAMLPIEGLIEASRGEPACPDMLAVAGTSLVLHRRQQGEEDMSEHDPSSPWAEMDGDWGLF